MRFSLFCRIYLFVALCSFAASEECLTPMKRKRASMRRYQPTRALFCMGCQPQHKHILLVDVTATEKLRTCSVREYMTHASQLKSLRRGVKPGDIILVTTSMPHAAPIMTAMAEQLRNVSMFTYNPSAALSRTCRTLRDSCFRLDSLLPVINQIQTFNEEHTEKRDASYNTYWISEKENVQNLSAIGKQLDRLENELCKRERRRNRLIEVGNSHFGDSRMPEVSLSLEDLLPLDPKAYDKNRAPKVSGKATVVHFHVTVLSLDSINEESMTYVADIFLAQSWRDPRLRLPGNMKEEYRILDVEWLRDIWRPDCFFKNAKKVTFHEMSIPNHYLWLYHDKTLLYMSKLTLVLSCAMKFESYPHDTQICLMMIESLSHTVQDLVFVWNATDPLVVNPEIELPQLDISKNYTADCTIEYSTGNFTCLAVVFSLKRRLGYHLFHTYIPSALIVVMSWISFWIKPEAIPARVTLGVTSLLTLATQNTQSQQSLPPVSYVKAIDVWMSSCSVFVFLSLMEFAVVNSYMEFRSSKPNKSYSRENIHSEFTLERVPSELNEVLECGGKETALFIDRFSRYFFPFSFFILNVVYWSTFLLVECRRYRGGRGTSEFPPGKSEATNGTCSLHKTVKLLLALRVDANIIGGLELVNEMRSDLTLTEAERKLRQILAKAGKSGLTESDVVRLSNAQRLCVGWKGIARDRHSHLAMLFFGFFTVLVYLSNVHTLEGFSRFWLRNKRGSIQDHQCTIWMPDELTKVFRPPVECSMCTGISRIDKVSNLTPDLFEERYAYSGRPVVITDGMINWTAQSVFSFDFFKEIYQSRMEHWVTYGCQFFPYNTEFGHLGEVFNMSRERAGMVKGTDPWYIGWSNCDEEVNVILRRHYDRPYFLPTTAETKRLDWIFMGSTGYGAPMHVDNVEHPSWQAQLRGRKLWKLQPPPECFYSCESIQVTVEPGEIIVLDTNRWYHSTLIVSEEMSITIGAEYD